MSIVTLPNKDFIKPITICMSLIICFFTTYYYTKGGFFDGILLTLLGISSTFLLILLSVLIFKLLTNILVKNSYRILGAITAFILTISFTTYIFLAVFTLVTKEF